MYNETDGMMHRTYQSRFSEIQALLEELGIRYTVQHCVMLRVNVQRSMNGVNNILQCQE